MDAIAGTAVITEIADFSKCYRHIITRQFIVTNIVVTYNESQEPYNPM